jgi:uncharacterized protein YdaU (DUF1376 family)
MAIQKPEWFKIDAAKFLADAAIDAMTTLELGTCFRLLCRQWIDGSIPDDLHLLARLCRLDDEVMVQAWVTLATFFPTIESGKRANRFMWVEREKVVTALEHKSDAGTRAARKRWDEARKSLDGPPMPYPMCRPEKPTRSPNARPDQTRAEQSRLEKTLPQTVFEGEPVHMESKTSKPTEIQVERLFKLYPRRVAKIDAKKAIRKAIAVTMAGDTDHPGKSLADAIDFLIERVTLYARSVQGSDPKFIPHPASWFNAGKFWDDAREWTRNANGKAAGYEPLPANYVPASEKLRREREAKS